jgi:uncharacterized protein (TIRG00374 family)
MKSIKSANLWMILCGSLSMFFAHYLRAYRWKMLSEASGKPINVRRAFYSVMTGYMVNAATSRGGEVARCALTAKSDKVPVETMVGTVITERIMDLTTLVGMCIICLCIQFNQFFGLFEQYILQPFLSHWLPVSFGLIAVIALVIWWFKRPKKISDVEKKETFISRLMVGIKSVFLLKNPVLFTAISFGIWLGYWSGTYFQLKALDLTAHLSFANALGVLIFSTIGIMIPIPGSVGVGFVIAYGLNIVYFISQAAAKTFGIFQVAYSNMFHIFFGAICYALLFFEIRKIEKLDEQSN